MAKYYISTGNFQGIVSSNKEPMQVLEECIHEFMGDYFDNGEVDEMDEFIYCDERGYRNYVSADPQTFVVDTIHLLQRTGYIK